MVNLTLKNYFYGFSYCKDPKKYLKLIYFILFFISSFCLWPIIFYATLFFIFFQQLQQVSLTLLCYSCMYQFTFFPFPLSVHFSLPPLFVFVLCFACVLFPIAFIASNWGLRRALLIQLQHQSSLITFCVFIWSASISSSTSSSSSSSSHPFSFPFLSFFLPIIFIASYFSFFLPCRVLYCTLCNLICECPFVCLFFV